MTDKPKPTLKGRLIAFGVSALLCAVATKLDVGTIDQRRQTRRRSSSLIPT